MGTKTKGQQKKKAGGSSNGGECRKGAARAGGAKTDQRGSKGVAGRLHPASAASEGAGGGAAEGDQSDVGGAEGGGGVRFRGIEYGPLPSQKKFHDSGARFKGFAGPVAAGTS